MTREEALSTPGAAFVYLLEAQQLTLDAMESLKSTPVAILKRQRSIVRFGLEALGTHFDYWVGLKIPQPLPGKLAARLAEVMQPPPPAAEAAPALQSVVAEPEEPEDKPGTWTHMAVAATVDRFDDKYLRETVCPSLTNAKGKRPSVAELRWECREARAKGYKVLPPCKNIDAEGRCKGHPTTEAALEARH